jgi:hypothetical protein
LKKNTNEEPRAVTPQVNNVAKKASSMGLTLSRDSNEKVRLI